VPQDQRFITASCRTNTIPRLGCAKCSCLENILSEVVGRDIRRSLPSLQVPLLPREPPQDMHRKICLRRDGILHSSLLTEGVDEIYEHMTRYFQVVNAVKIFGGLDNCYRFKLGTGLYQ
jgi:hypothetical protein